MQADALTLHKVLQTRLRQYLHQAGKPMSTPAIAQLLAITLYSRRFFPYYTFNVVVGLDEKGDGCCFTYDAVGSFERVPYASSGSGSNLVIPLLDNQLKKMHVGAASGTHPPHNPELSEAVDLVRDALTCADERDIHTGDGADLAIITKDGVRMSSFPLKVSFFILLLHSCILFPFSFSFQIDVLISQFSGLFLLFIISFLSVSLCFYLFLFLSLSSWTKACSLALAHRFSFALAWIRLLPLPFAHP